jgi:hypothetical protein
MRQATRNQVREGTFGSQASKRKPGPATGMTQNKNAPRRSAIFTGETRSVRRPWVSIASASNPAKAFGATRDSSGRSQHGPLAQ